MAKRLLHNNGAIHFHNKIFKRRSLRIKLLKESAVVTSDSLVVLEEFERFEEDFLLNDLSGQGHGGERK